MRQRPLKNAYFMALAESVRTRSPDPKTQVGCVLVDDSDRVIGTGYNGPPAGFDDQNLNWTDRENIYKYVVHAEMNAILYSGSRYDDRAKLYTTLSPCHHCIKLIAAAGIKKVFYRERYKDFDLVEKLANEFGIILTQQEVEQNG